MAEAIPDWSNRWYVRGMKFYFLGSDSNRREEKCSMVLLKNTVPERQGSEVGNSQKFSFKVEITVGETNKEWGFWRNSKAGLYTMNCCSVSHMAGFICHLSLYLHHLTRYLMHSRSSINVFASFIEWGIPYFGPFSENFLLYSSSSIHINSRFRLLYLCIFCKKNNWLYFSSLGQVYSFYILKWGFKKAE